MERIARDVAESRGLDEWQAARLFGLLNMAMADGYVASWRVKYDVLFWRPVTAIRTADTDGNRNTTADPTWTPLQRTYPIPDHDSGHSVEGGAAAEVLKRFFGTDDISFANCSFTLPIGSRCIDAIPSRARSTRCKRGAEENGLSRILVGIHFRRATDQGIRHGRRIAIRAFKFLRPVRAK